MRRFPEVNRESLASVFAMEVASESLLDRPRSAPRERLLAERTDSRARAGGKRNILRDPERIPRSYRRYALAVIARLRYVRMLFTPDLSKDRRQMPETPERGHAWFFPTHPSSRDF
jgi:hypothetical protein